MQNKMLQNDLKRNKLVTLTLVLFIACASLLASLAAALAVNLSDAINALMARAETPHFLQMHSGDIDMEQLSAFASNNSDVDKFQVLRFLNLEGGAIRLGDELLTDSTQDNGLSVQSGSFDYLLDLEGNIIQPEDGQLYVPVCYLQDHTASVGDRAEICGEPFVIAGFLRDSQMNSMLASSKRFLVSNADYERLEGCGNVEYLIEFRLKDMNALGSFAAAYTASGLPANGPVITYPLFRMINALSDGIMIAVILLVSAAAVLIALLCIRFALLAEIEEDYREIGVMKALGLRLSCIRRIYLAKYALLAALGCMAGFLLSFPCRDILLANIKLVMGESGKKTFSILLGFLAALLLFYVILLFIRNILKRFGKISASGALRFGAPQEQNGIAGKLRLCRRRLPGANISYGLHDILSRKKIYAAYLAILIFASFIIIFPQKLYETLSSKGFAAYMGIGNCELRIDIQQTDRISEKTAEAAQVLAQDSDISSFTVLNTGSFSIRKEDGALEQLKIELGDHSSFPVAYTEGFAPAKEDELALSALNSKELEKGIGDTITILTEEGERQLTICGIYSDITNGGKTAKAAFPSSGTMMWSIIYAELNEHSLVEEKTEAYSRYFPFAKVTDIRSYINKTYGPTLHSVKLAAFAAAAAALMVTAFITLLFVKLLAAKDRYSNAVMKACGFTNRDLSIQYMARSAVLLAAGILLGILFTNTAGEGLASFAFSAFGAASFRFLGNPGPAYTACLLLMALLAAGTTAAAAHDVRNIKISETIKE